MAIERLDPPIPLLVLEKGKGLAHLVIDYGVEHSLIWVVALDEGGECWCAPNEKIRFLKNWTMGRTASKLPIPRDQAQSEAANV